MKSANSSSSSRARSGSVRTNDGDRAERVVDEVRADLRPQRPHLRLHQPGAGRVELGELELPATPTPPPRGWRAPGCPWGTAPAR